MSRFFGIGLDFGDLFCEQRLVGHHHHRNRAAAIWFEPFANTLRVITCGVHNVFAANVTLFRVNDPFAIFAVDPSGRSEAQDLRAHITRTFGKRLS